MTYCTLADLSDRYGDAMLRGLTDRATPPAGVVNAAVVNRALADADAAIDGYLLGRYALPLATVPPLLVDLAQAIAIYKLHRNITDEKIRLDYEDAMRRLREIAAGTLRLNVAGSEPQGGSSNSVETTASERPFTGGRMDGFI